MQTTAKIIRLHIKNQHEKQSFKQQMFLTWIMLAEPRFACLNL
jgi:hypothetical protein